jgi:energy-coupling factor transporter ATP-binding protein EcfA2
LAAGPRLILADEPTAALDKQSGREVVELMRNLAKAQGVTVVLVTHDPRILDIADRIISLEDGRLASFTEAVAANTHRMMGLLASTNRRGDLARRIADVPDDEFAPLLQQVTGESQHFLEAVEMASNEAFQSMLEQTLEAFTLKLGSVLRAERASLFLVDRANGELWSKVAQGDGDKPLEVRIPLGAGIAGEVEKTGKILRVDDAYRHPLFNREVDERTGFRTRNLLCAPILDREGRVFAVAQLLNRRDADHFDESDEARFRQFSESIGRILLAWWRMSQGKNGG